MIIKNDNHLEKVTEEMEILWEDMLEKYPDCKIIARIDEIFNAMVDYEERN